MRKLIRPRNYLVKAARTATFIQQVKAAVCATAGDLKLKNDGGRQKIRSKVVTFTNVTNLTFW